MDGQIVVVEDEPEVLDLLGDVLDMGGFSVTGVTRPDLVWDAIKTGLPDLFLLDVMLPGMSGIELAQQLRETIRDCPPIIALSASRLMLGVAENSGYFVSTISKPFDIETLLTAVEDVLQPVDDAVGHFMTRLGQVSEEGLTRLRNYPGGTGLTEQLLPLL